MYTCLYSLCSEAMRILNVTSVPEKSILNALARRDVSTIQKLKDADLETISTFRCIGAVRLGIIMKMKELLEDTVPRDTQFNNSYVYSLLDDKFSYHEGIIAPTYYAQFGIFRSNDNYSTTVSMTPGEVYNGVVWLPDRNDEEAKRLFISHYTNKRETLKRQLDLANNKLKVLEDT